MSREIKKKIIHIKLGARKFKYTEIIEELFDVSEVIDLTKNDKPTLSKRRPAAAKLRLKIPERSNNNTQKKNEESIDLTKESVSSESDYILHTPMGYQISPMNMPTSSPVWPGQYVHD